MQSKKSLGELGEDVAKNYLMGKGYLLMERNYRSRYGEIDLIMSKNGRLIFVEVKTRSSTLFGGPLDSFVWTKKRRLLKTIFCYLDEEPLKKSWRVDLLGILVDQTAKKYHITHVRNISLHTGR